MGANPGYLNQNAGLNPFTANSNILGLAGGMNAGGGFIVGGDTGLASHAARMGFAHAANLQQQQHAQQQGHNVLNEHPARDRSKGRIREVWKHNLHEEMANLRDLVDKYPYVAMVGHRPLWRT
jgi:CCR4-NOT transcription complex subunit 7/8